MTEFCDIPCLSDRLLLSRTTVKMEQINITVNNKTIDDAQQHSSKEIVKAQFLLRYVYLLTKFRMRMTIKLRQAAVAEVTIPALLYKMASLTDIGQHVLSYDRQ